MAKEGQRDLGQNEGLFLVQRDTWEIWSHIMGKRQDQSFIICINEEIIVLVLKMESF